MSKGEGYPSRAVVAQYKVPEPSTKLARYYVMTSFCGRENCSGSRAFMCKHSEHFIQPMAAQDPMIDFDCASRDISICQWVKFWDSMRLWLLERGYILYEHGYHWNNKYIGDFTFTAPKTPSIGNGTLPYAFFGGDPTYIPVPPLSAEPVVRLMSTHLSCASSI